MSSKRNQLLLMGKSGSQGSNDVHIAIVGAAGCGKSAMTVRFMTRRFISEYDPDLEDTYVKHDVIDGQEVTFRIMDTCDKDGKDASRYMQWTDAFIVVYSITDHTSFVEAQKYLELVSQKDVFIGVVGNKSDLENSRQVTFTEGSDLSAQYEATFHELSVAESYGHVESVFFSVVRDFLRLQEKGSGSFMSSWRNQSSIDDKSVGLGDRLRILGSSKLNLPRDRDNKFSLFKGKSLRNIFQS